MSAELWFLWLLSTRAPACAPPVVHALCTAPDAEVWSAPIADFAHELEALVPTVAYRASMLRTDEVEQAALRAGGVDDAGLERWAAWRRGSVPDRPELPGLSPEGLAYAEAAVRWNRGDRLAAWAAFERIAADPLAGERGLWAATMVAGNDADWDGIFERVDAGVPDRLGLAAFALGEQARIRLSAGDWRSAVDGYLAQLGAGHPGAVPSLEIVCRRAVAEEALGAWATDPVLRRVLTAFFLAHGGPVPDPGEVERTRAWLAAVEAAGDGVLPEAERLAWAAYQIGEVDLAGRWLERAAPTPLARWLRGKLLLREGRIEEGEQLLVAAAEGFGETERWPTGAMGREGPDERDPGIRPGREAWAEAGVARLSQGDFSGAATAFVSADRWADAAYVVERVLTPDEARTFVLGLGPAQPAEPDAFRGVEAMTPDERKGALRYLLARRLLREGRPDAARPLLPSALQPAADRWATDLQIGRSRWRGNEARAGALWDAALLARTHGFLLLGTEVEPDFALYTGEYADGPHPTERAGTAGPRLVPTDDERARVAASAPRPDVRWHYRGLAAALAEEAAGLLQDDDPRMPIVLCRASVWTRDRDPETSQRLYREVFRRGADWPGEPCGEPTFDLTSRPISSGWIVALASGLWALALLAFSALRRRARPGSR